MLEAVLKLREGAHVAAEAHETEQLLHGHLAAVDPSVRCFVLEGEGRAAERARRCRCARSASSAATPCSCRRRIRSSTSSASSGSTVDLAEARGIDPDLIRWDEEPWDRARKAQDVHGRSVSR